MRKTLQHLGGSLAHYLDTYNGRHDLIWFLIPWSLGIIGMIAVIAQ